MKEYILCAAIFHQGDTDDAGFPLIYCGHRHNNVLWQSDKVSRKPHDQGFLTNTGKFVNRIDAMNIALEANQVKKENLHNPLIGLFSEDLY